MFRGISNLILIVMTKTIETLGTSLSRAEQQKINGGLRYCEQHTDCPPSTGCCATHNLCMAPWMYNKFC
ncbi:conserved hypothetical protein [Tenacibaculum litopenaei]